MLRSKLKLFEKGDQLICVHDVINLHQGDLVVVYDICDSCLGLILEGIRDHYQDEHFEKFSDEKFRHIDNDSIDKAKVVNVFTDIIKVMMLNSHRGVFNVDPVINAIKHNIIVLNLDNEFKKPLNKPEEPGKEN